MFACCLWVRMSCDVGLQWLISAVIRRLGVYANVRRKAKKYKHPPAPRAIYRGLGIRPLSAPSLSSPPSLPTVRPAPAEKPSTSTAPSPSPYSHSAQLLQLIALPLRLLRFALSGRCSPFSGNLAITSLFILMSPSPHGNVANLKAVLGQKLISREISSGSEACIFYEKGDRAIRMSTNLLLALGMLWRSTGVC